MSLPSRIFCSARRIELILHRHDFMDNTDLKKSTQWLRRYFSLITLGVIAAIVYMIFFSDTSVVKKIKYQHIIDSLRIEVEATHDSMLFYKEINSRLSTDREVMEQIVREQHYMKRPNEDVYTFTTE